MLARFGRTVKEFCGVGVADAIVFLRVHVNQERVVNDFGLEGLHIFTSD